MRPGENDAMIAPTRKPFMTRRTIKILTDKARNTAYRFGPVPDKAFRTDYGIYIHVPFCRSICSFCPYYREIFSAPRKERYLGALLREIARRDFAGTASWLYVGGGTPNTLSLQDWDRIIAALKSKAEIPNAGIESTPAGLDRAYAEGLKALGFGKASIGVESFSGAVLREAGREDPGRGRAEAAVEASLSAGLWTNVDLMIGFDGQKAFHFREDVKRLIGLGAQQATLYPLMTIRGTRANRLSMDDRTIFGLIEEAGKALESAGFRRRTLWTWTRGAELYDSSYDELGSDYLGLGPSGISSTRAWVSVNPPLDAYEKTVNGPGHLMAFTSEHAKGRHHEAWRRFGMMLYGRRLSFSPSYPAYLNAFISFLMASGRGGPGFLTKKGIIFAHDMTKAVVETKSFPLQHPGCVENLADYEAYAGAPLEPAGGSP
jgi:menaquinone C8-methyltransferase